MSSNGRQSANGAKGASCNFWLPLHYLHVQRGDLIVGVLGTTSSATLGAMWVAGPVWLTSLALLLQLAGALAFCSSVIEIADDQLRVRYGPGWIRRKFALSDIVSCRVVKSLFAYGWGVGRRPQGYSYKPSRSLALELQLRGGYRVRIGTDRPLELLNAILLASNGDVQRAE